MWRAATGALSGGGRHGRLLQVLGVEAEDLLPGVLGLLRTTAWPIGGEEAVPGAVIPIELVLLARFLERFLYLVDLCRRWELVVVTENTQQRTVHLWRQ